MVLPPTPTPSPHTHVQLLDVDLDDQDAGPSQFNADADDPMPTLNVHASSDDNDDDDPLHPFVDDMGNYFPASSHSLVDTTLKHDSSESSSHQPIPFVDGLGNYFPVGPDLSFERPTPMMLSQTTSAATHTLHESSASGGWLFRWLNKAWH